MDACTHAHAHADACTWGQTFSRLVLTRASTHAHADALPIFCPMLASATPFPATWDPREGLVHYIRELLRSFPSGQAADCHQSGTGRGWVKYGVGGGLLAAWALCPRAGLVVLLWRQVAQCCAHGDCSNASPRHHTMLPLRHHPLFVRAAWLVRARTRPKSWTRGAQVVCEGRMIKCRACTLLCARIGRNCRGGPSGWQVLSASMMPQLSCSRLDVSCCLRSPRFSSSSSSVCMYTKTLSPTP